MAGVGSGRPLTPRDREQALIALRAACALHGRGVSQREFEAFCAERHLGRPWRGYHLTQHRNRVDRRVSWSVILQSIGYSCARWWDNRTTPTERRPLQPGQRYCQNQPDCVRIPKPPNRFCKTCQARWTDAAPDTGVAGIARGRR